MGGPHFGLSHSTPSPPNQSTKSFPPLSSGRRSSRRQTPPNTQKINKIFSSFPTRGHLLWPGSLSISPDIQALDPALDSHFPAISGAETTNHHQISTPLNILFLLLHSSDPFATSIAGTTVAPPPLLPPFPASLAEETQTLLLPNGPYLAPSSNLWTQASFQPLAKTQNLCTSMIGPNG